MIEESVLQSNFIGRDGFRWWIGQIPPEESHGDQINQTGDSWGNRLKVRIMGYHPQNEEELKNEDLPWAQILLGATDGSGGGAQASPGSGTTGGSTNQSSANPSSPFTINDYGFAGGNGGAYPPKAGAGGGGGAGGAGEAGSPTVGGNGGFGRQLPSTFHNPDSAPGPNGGGLGAIGPGSGDAALFWVAGGGAGGNIFTPVTASYGGAGPSGTATYAGGGGPAGPGAQDGIDGMTNTGGGGGGDVNSSDGNRRPGGNGGSGIVLIAYPT